MIIKISRYSFRFILIFSVSFLILFNLYRKIDFIDLLSAIANSNLYLLTLGFLISVILSIIGGWRYSFFPKLIGFNDYPKFSTSFKSYFLASSINLVLPSKLGDLGKGIICEKIDNKKYPFEIHIFSLYEKVSDLFAIFFIGSISSLLFRFFTLNINQVNYFSHIDFFMVDKFELLIYIFTILLFFLLLPFNYIKRIHGFRKYLPPKIYSLISFGSNFSFRNFFAYQLNSLITWFLHLLQICIFAKSININLFSLPGLLIIVYTILFGLLPISFGGVGTREAVLVFFLSPYYGQVLPLLLGALLTARYLFPAIVSLFLVKKLV